MVGPLQLPGEYRGLDISDVIVARNRDRYPDRRFAAADFATAEDVHRFEADMVLCLDVLIHQHDRQDYDRMVGRLVGAARRGGLVSGYTSYPRAQYRGRITSYHEPLTTTLARAGARDIRVVGSYRDTAMIAFGR